MGPIGSFIERRVAVFTEKSAFVKGDGRGTMVIGSVVDSLPDAVIGAAVRAE